MKRNSHAFTLVELPAVSKIKRVAFTLVELLVVIGIIAVLISILLPALNSARQQAYSAQCLSNLKQVGQAALMYAGENHGWFPPSHAGNLNGVDNTDSISRTDSAFLDWGKLPADGTTGNNASRWGVSEAMARYAGYKWSPNYVEGGANTNYVAPRTPIFFCPTYNQLVSGIAYPDNNLLNHDASVGTGVTKMTYLWVANPYHCVCPLQVAAVQAAPFNGNEDLVAACTNSGGQGGGFCHMDLYPDQKDYVDFDSGRPCRPGYDYLRKTSDKRAQEVQICVDNARQQQSGFFYYPHGNMTGHILQQYGVKGLASTSGSNTATTPAASNGVPAGYWMTIAPKAWFNELFGDGHAESRRGDQLRFRWASSNPQAW